MKTERYLKYAPTRDVVFVLGAGTSYGDGVPLQRYNRNVSIITLNYDTLLEQAFQPLYSETGYIDDCIHLMNYEKHDALKEFQSWVNPREPVLAEPHENPSPFRTGTSM